MGTASETLNSGFITDCDNNPDCAELISGYALNALSDASRAEAERVLARSESARRLLSDLQSTLAGIAALSPYQQAPARAEAAFKARLAASADMPDVAPKPRQTVSRSLRARLMLSAAALIVLAIGALVVVSSRPQPSRIERILNDAAARSVTLAAQGGAQGTIRAVRLPGESTLVLVAELPPLGAENGYQLWFIDNATILSGGVFSVVDAPYTMLVELPAPNVAYTLGITVEKVGGSEQPTSSPIFLGAVPQ